ncbi:MAG: hypothetical protein EBZ04_12700, partial [Betaproteobacteria bacterium]|nr:hypothetical protein [Betaproteobacteria bacterium]
MITKKQKQNDNKERKKQCASDVRASGPAKHDITQHRAKHLPSSSSQAPSTSIIVSIPINKSHQYFAHG